MNSVIAIKGLKRNYGPRCVVDGIDFEFGPGRIIGLIGPNGSGKTTTLKSMLGLIPSAGELRVMGRDPRTQRDEMMGSVCFIADVAILPKWLSVREALIVVGGLHPQFDRNKAERYLATSGLDPTLKVRQMSKGQIVCLHLALIMAINAELLILDEPTLGLDPVQKEQFYQALLNDYFDNDKTIMISSHEIAEIENLLTDVMFIQNGKIVVSGTIDEINHRYSTVAVDSDKINAAVAFLPVARSKILGKNVMLFDGVAREKLEAFGKVSYPTLSDLFSLQMRGQRI